MQKEVEKENSVLQQYLNHILHIANKKDLINQMGLFNPFASAD